MWFVVAAARPDTGLLLSPKINGRNSADYICKSRYISSIFWCQFRGSLSLAQVMAWRVTGDKSLPEKMETKCTSVFMRLSLSISEGTRYHRHENGVFALYLLNVIFYGNINYMLSFAKKHHFLYSSIFHLLYSSIFHITRYQTHGTNW